MGLDSTTTRSVIDIVTKTVDKAFHASPSDSKGGYELAAGIMAIAIIALAVAVAWGARHYIRSQAAGRRELAHGRSQRIDELKKLIVEGLADVKVAQRDSLGAIQSQLEGVRNRVDAHAESIAGLKAHTKFKD